MERGVGRIKAVAVHAGAHRLKSEGIWWEGGKDEGKGKERKGKERKGKMPWILT